jgi:hypothetical protein
MFPVRTRINMATNGEITKNHDTPVYPFLQKKFNIHVHIAMNAILIRTYKKGR